MDRRQIYVRHRDKGSRRKRTLGVDRVIDTNAASMSGVSRDATSGKYVPASADEWTQTRAAAGILSGNPSSLWLCQTNGSVDDAIGAVTLSESGVVSYQQSVTGWAGQGVRDADHPPTPRGG